VTRLKTWLRRLRTLLWTALAMVIIGAAVLVGVGKLLMPYSERFKPRLEAVLAEQFNQPVRVDAFTGEWKAFGPRISLEGVNLLGGEGGDDALAIRRAALDIKPLNAFIKGRPLYSFLVLGADLALVRFEDGHLELSGLGLSGREVDTEGGAGLRNLARVGEVRLQDSRFAFRDEARDLQLQLVGIDGRLQVRGDRLAVEVQASVTGTRQDPVLGDLAATVLARLDDADGLANLEFHLQTGELMLDRLAGYLPEHDLKPSTGRINAQLWGAWAPGEPQELAGVVDLRDVRLDTEDGALLLDHLNARLDWRWRDKTQWRIDLADVRVQENGRDWTAPRVAVERNLEGNLGVWVSADELQAEFPLEVTQVIMKELGRRWPRAAPTAGRGPVSDFDLVIDRGRQLTAVSGRFNDLDVLEWDRWPLPRGLSGRIDLAFGEGSLFFSGEDVAVHWPRNFTEPLVADFPGCEVEILWEGRSYWQVDALPCALRTGPLAGEARARFVKDEGKPRVDVNAVVHRADVAALEPYWPRSIMSPALTDWLGRSLTAGGVDGARFVLQGDMDRFPFRSGEGALLVEAALDDLRLDYAPDWPAAQGIEATARFDGPALRVTGRIGDIAGAAVGTAEAYIADLQAPVLDLAWSSETGLPNLEAFLGATPLLDDSELDLTRFAFEGPASLRGDLTLPLRTGRDGFVLDAQLAVTEGRFTERESGLRLEGLTGTVDITGEGATARALDATLAGWPATLDLAAAWGTAQPFEATLSGRFPPSLLLSQAPLGDGPLLSAAQGEADWRLAFSVLRPDAGAEAEPASGPGSRVGPRVAAGVDSPPEFDLWLEVTSDLQGVSLDLPAPLDKAPDARWPLALRYPLRARAPVLRASLGERLDLVTELERTGDDRTGVARGALMLGGARAELPEPGQFALGGAVGVLDLDGWLERIVDAAKTERYPSGLAFRGADLAATELLLMNRRFDAVALGLDYDGEVLGARFDGEAISGDLSYRRNDDGSHSLSAQMERLHLPDPMEEGMDMDTDPTALPEMRFYVQDFRFMGLDLGETRLEAFPIADGLRIETVDAASDQLTFQARGDWIVDPAGQSRSDFDIVLTSESLGAIVDALDLSSVLEGGQTMVRYDAWWPGPPAAFELSRLNGQMSFSVVDGRILNADPGAGRMLGLISVGALPRRLALDFSDVFESGFGFDQANGTLRLDSGTAHTDDFLLESTAATLTIAGSSDLEAQEFDYVMSVRPGVSQALPVLGAIAAGPAGVAAGIALQELLRDALGDATEARYEITGPWSEPAVERIPVAPPAAAENSPAQTQTTEET